MADEDRQPVDGEAANETPLSLRRPATTEYRWAGGSLNALLEPLWRAAAEWQRHRAERERQCEE